VPQLEHGYPPESLSLEFFRTPLAGRDTSFAASSLGSKETKLSGAIQACEFYPEKLMD
jgi:hypothetical protein